MNALRLGLLAAALCLMPPVVAHADDGVCDHCGCSSCVRKVCVPKMIEKETVKVCWDYKCEDVCIPGRSKKCGVECREDACGCWSFNVWQPTCARVKTRRVPVKTEVKRKVPAVEWVVEYRCANCCGAGCTDAKGVAPNEASADANSGDAKPQPPAPEEAE